MGWTREEAIEYMLEHTAAGYNAIASEVDRYVAASGQAASYLLASLPACQLASLKIQRLRHVAQEKLGAKFDIEDFHDQVIAHGNISLPMLKRAIGSWIEEQPSGNN